MSVPPGSKFLMAVAVLSIVACGENLDPVSSTPTSGTNWGGEDVGRKSAEQVARISSLHGKELRVRLSSISPSGEVRLLSSRPIKLVYNMAKQSVKGEKIAVGADCVNPAPVGNGLEVVGKCTSAFAHAVDITENEDVMEAIGYVYTQATAHSTPVVRSQIHNDSTATTNFAAVDSTNTDEMISFDVARNGDIVGAYVATEAGVEIGIEADYDNGDVTLMTMTIKFDGEEAFIVQVSDGQIIHARDAEELSSVMSMAMADCWSEALSFVGAAASWGGSVLGGGIGAKAAMKAAPRFVATVRGSIVYGPAKKTVGGAAKGIITAAVSGALGSWVAMYDASGDFWECMAS